MSRISKDLANTISEKLTIKLDKKISEIQKELTEYVSEIYYKRIPAKVIELNKEFPSYISKSIRIKFFGNGLNGEEFKFISPLPCKTNEDSFYGITINDLNQDYSKKLIELNNKCEALKAEKIQLKQSIYNALLQLVTYKRIIEQFPEAAPYLERKDAYALAIPVEDIRKQLKNLE
ncbi:Nmad5 family putative nucleotide modification protein [Chishuiella sp.]|uniref:Nmad5 family putative nucleotide modification protein n=1 Tax=Chishuiella sp. TaxID=1969467 RepID=UPI0028B15D34|nr:Nmad5 family putative nucleotide modification protein [Chishuiella sp.]